MLNSPRFLNLPNGNNAALIVNINIITSIYMDEEHINVIAMADNIQKIYYKISNEKEYKLVWDLLIKLMEQGIIL